MSKCENCEIKKDYAKSDFHWFGEDDCPFVCPFESNEKKECE